jgi:hypothetical protein
MQLVPSVSRAIDFGLAARAHAFAPQGFGKVPSNREILQRHLTMIIDPFVFGFARTYSANASFSLRYRDHAQWWWADEVLGGIISGY